jgi:hypothetical protein
MWLGFSDVADAMLDLGDMSTFFLLKDKNAQGPK